MANRQLERYRASGGNDPTVIRALTAQYNNQQAYMAKQAQGNFTPTTAFTPQGGANLTRKGVTGTAGGIQTMKPKAPAPTMQSRQTTPTSSTSTMQNIGIGGGLLTGQKGPNGQPTGAATSKPAYSGTLTGNKSGGATASPPATNTAGTKPAYSGILTGNKGATTSPSGTSGVQRAGVGTGILAGRNNQPQPQAPTAQPGPGAQPGGQTAQPGPTASASGGFLGSAGNGSQPSPTTGTGALGGQAGGDFGTGADPHTGQYSRNTKIGEFIGKPTLDNPDSWMFTGPNVRSIQGEDTVQGQLANIQRNDSDLMKLAELRGLEQASKRGLLNSSLAADSAQLAVLKEAMPIAQQDASAYLKQGLTNQEAENQFLSRLQEGAITGSLERQRGGIEQDRMKLGASLDIGKMREEAELKYDQWAKENSATKQQEMAKQIAALQAQYIQGAAEINKADMDVEDKQTQIAELKAGLQESMKLTAEAYNVEPAAYSSWLVDMWGEAGNAVAKAVAAPSTGITNGADRINPETGMPEYKVGDNYYSPGDRLPAGYTWATDPATGSYRVQRFEPEFG